MASYLRLAAEALGEDMGSQGSWARRLAEGLANLGTFNGATVGALSGQGNWLRQLYEALDPRPSYVGGSWYQRLGGGDGLHLYELVQAEAAFAPPEGFGFVIDGDGNYVVDASGAYVIQEI